MACLGLAGCPADPEPGGAFPEGEGQSPATDDPEGFAEGEFPEREGEAVGLERSRDGGSFPEAPYEGPNGDESSPSRASH